MGILAQRCASLKYDALAMTTCVFGASVKPGQNPNAEIVITRAQWEVLTGTASSWLDPILDTFQPSVVKVSDLCTLNVDDPGDLALSTIINAFLKNPASLLDMANWARAKMAYVAFQANCVCNGTTGVCDSLFGRPFSSMPNTATRGAGDVDYGTAFTCTNAGDLTAFGFRDWVPSSGTTRLFKLWDLTAGTQLWSQTATVTGAGYHEVNCTTVTTLIAGHNYVVTIRYQSGDTVNLQNSGYAGSAGAYISGISSVTNHPSGSGTPTLYFSGACVPVEPVVCAGVTTPHTPTVPVQPSDLVLPPSWSCGTTADICTRLQQISDRLDWARADITLIQRQHVPFAYLLGTPSTGLTGSGSISVQGILGVVVSLTTVPTSWGRTQDTPRRLIPAAGQVMFSTTDGDSMAELVHYDHDMVLGVSGVVTSVKYSFRPGIVATITPLSREF